MKNKTPVSIRFATFFCSAALLAIPSISSGEGTVGIGTGFDFSSGEYGGSTTTEITSIPVNTKYQNDFFALKLSIPFIKIKSEGNSVIVDGNVINVVDEDGNVSDTSNSESGLGDIVFSGTYFLYEGSEVQPLFPMIDLTGKIKFPTADEDKGLGTGETDYSIESDFTWFSGQTALFTTIGYKFIGSPDDFELNDVIYGSIGVAHQIAANFSGGLLYDVKEATTDSGTGTSEATAYVSYKLRDDIKFLFYGVKGFSDGSPDYGVGFTVSYSMDADEVDWMAPVRRISNL